MEDWSGDFFKALEAISGEIEQFLTQVTEEAIDTFTKLSEDVIVQIEWGVTELDRNLEELFEPIYEALIEFEWQVNADLGPLESPTDPLQNQHAACVGCQHYHGQSYGGTMLVCGMHPYGWDGDRCPDWEMPPSI
ncbi:hypothetical protein BST81_12605 [Leptolyngbya sp. 'hensonii']|uniref:hypothetical protein n=1 Tax=Leptolyngbya sp. 'hensonii' TaxID=1922337 RepID=UPI00094F5A77|nr:hypothetical protein [Leptolyngbya sp. 'hensonii']OLP17893.1 hypothetical protein BST81_12605 [Leptolyngbya sp. 'hensonii']